MNPQYQSLDELLHKCLHCGLCLPVCPTYSITYKEESSPRGRIRLMKSVQDGSLPLSENFVEEMYFCLDCQACQTACPAGVQYGELVEDARALIAETNKDPLLLRLTKLGLLSVVTSKTRTKVVAGLMSFYQRSGLREAVDASGILSLISEQLSVKHALLPKISDERFDKDLPEVIPARGKQKGRVAFLSGCIMNVAFADVHRDSVELLTKIGYEVVIPKLQQCCGSLHGHHGEREEAKNLARKNIDAFGQFQFDALIVDSAGCSAFMKEYGRLLADDAAYAQRAEAFSASIQEITEFLSDKDFGKALKPVHQRITYHEACHLVHTQQVSKQPRALLQSIPGIEFVELPEATWCCGSAGLYNAVRTEDSMKFLERKMENIKTTDAEIVVTANPGCHLQIQYGIAKNGLKMEVMHPVTLLNKSIL